MSPMNNRLLVPTQPPGVLDFAPGAAAAYSLRSLSRSYAGPVVTVRRSSDPDEAPFTAAEVSDGTLAAFCGAGDGFVKQWWDQSGNANHASQTTPGYQPQIVSSGTVVVEGDRPSIDFNLGVSVALTASVNTDGFHLLFVGKNTKVGTNGCFFEAYGTARHLVFLDPDGDLSINTPSPNAIGKATGFSAISLSFFDTSITAHVNAVRTADGITAANAAAANTSIIIGNDSTLGNDFGKISELIVYDTDKADLLDLITGNQMWYY